MGFLQWTDAGYINCTPSQATCSGIIGQHKTYSVFCFLLLWSVFVLFIFSFEREKGYEVGWRGEGIWGEVEGEERICPKYIA